MPGHGNSSAETSTAEQAGADKQPGTYLGLLEHLAQGGLLLYVTETVWGLGCDPTSTEAVEAIRRAKGTPEGQPYSIAIADPGELEEYVILSPLARELADTFLPGPLTLIATLQDPSRKSWEPAVGTGRAVGLRCPSHPVTQALLAQVGPLVSTSANYHGSAPPTTIHQLAEFSASLLASGGVRVRTVNGTPEPRGRPSTVIDVTGQKPKVLRWGAVGPRKLGGYLPG